MHGSPRARIAKTLLLWLVLCLAWLPFGAKRHFGELYDGAMTDHASHLNRVRAFMRVGPAVWATPAMELGLTLSDGHINWPELPVMYPAGMLVLHLPLALTVEAGMPLERASLMTIFFYLLGFACVATVLAEQLHRRSPDVALHVLFALGLLGFVVRGFYDVWPVLVLLLAFREERAERALLWWAVAAFLHYRVFFTAPFAALWAWDLVRRGAWRQLVIPGVLVGASLCTFALSASFLSRLPETNPTHAMGPAIAVVVAVAVFVAFSAYARVSWRVTVPVVLLILATMLPRQTMSWHAYLLWPAMFSWRADEPMQQRWARYALFIVVMFVGMRGEWPGRWLGFL
ncbi:MAG: hypothetical protein JNM17_16395 [Archangium sp.]|nr:hypothetical protein [Archangium sp.]